MNEKAKKTFAVMIERGYIPESGPFDITTELVELSSKVRLELFPPVGQIEPARPTDLRYYNKLAYLNLMKVLSDRGTEVTTVAKASPKKPAAGFVYIVKNPAFAGLVKIGITRDLNKRLGTYQTGDPYRRYEVVCYKLVEHMKLAEENLLAKCKNNTLGEWADEQTALSMFYQL